jgi:serine/threonine-protein kinase
MARAPAGGLGLRDYLHSTGILPRREWDDWLAAGGEPPRLEGYTIEGKLGEGGTALIYLARHREAGKVALKVARPEVVRRRESLAPFLREGKLLQELAHPGLVRCRKVARQGQVLYMVLEYVPGETVLDRLMREEPFPEGESLRITLAVARTLGHLADRGVVHRDVKPGNIMLTPAGGVKLLDLGFAAAAGQEEGGDTTSGTAHYMAPEQARGGAGDHRSDIYSLGVTLFHMVTGELPFDTGDKREVMRAHIRDRLSSAALKGRSFTPLLAYFVKKMTARQAAERYQDAAALVADLAEKSSSFLQVREQGRVERVARKGRRRRGR